MHSEHVRDVQALGELVSHGSTSKSACSDVDGHVLGGHPIVHLAARDGVRFLPPADGVRAWEADHVVKDGATCASEGKPCDEHNRRGPRHPASKSREEWWELMNRGS